jgi:3-dehydroquinate dehydratase / shikimate dehydrogenase
VVAAATAAEMASQLKRGAGLTSTAELRLDWLAGEEERGRFLAWLHRWLPRQKKPLLLIATCRRKQAGGRYSGSVASERRILDAAVRAGCRWYDLEVESARSASGFQPVDSGRGEALAILSLHRFEPVHEDPAKLLRRFPAAPKSIWKLAVGCRNLSEALRLERAAQISKHRDRMILVPMGNAALPMRILALRRASLLTYAAVAQRTAPGQPTLETVLQEYRADRIDPRARVYGIIGNPVGHSVSPAMHNAAFAARGVNAIYLPFPVEDLEDFLAAIRPIGICGFSVTIPHKQAIFRRLHACDPLAERLGAVSTVIVRNGRLYGYNMDYAGVLSALQGHVKLNGSRALVLGAGGAARAGAFALADSGARVFVNARREEQARQLAKLVGGQLTARPQIRRQSFDLIVNTTPLGMAPDTSSPLAAKEINAPVVFDMVYRPLETPLLRLAARKGSVTISGLEMLVAQGAKQWELWTGQQAPIGRMRQAAMAALGRDKDDR